MILNIFRKNAESLINIETGDPKRDHLLTKSKKENNNTIINRGDEDTEMTTLLGGSTAMSTNINRIPAFFKLVIGSDSAQQSTAGHRKIQVNVNTTKMSVFGRKTNKTKSNFQTHVLPYLTVPPKINEAQALREISKAGDEEKQVMYEWQVGTGSPWADSV